MQIARVKADDLRQTQKLAHAVGQLEAARLAAKQQALKRAKLQARRQAS